MLEMVSILMRNQMRVSIVAINWAVGLHNAPISHQIARSTVIHTRMTSLCSAGNRIASSAIALGVKYRQL